MSAFDLLNGSLELLIVLGCVLGSRAVIRRYWTGGGIVPSRPSGIVWLTLLSTVAVFYFLAALQAFGVPIRNGTIEGVLGLGFVCVHAAHMLALVIRQRRRSATSSRPSDLSAQLADVLPSSPPSPMRVDPGWDPALRRLGIGFIPIIGLLRMRRRRSVSPDGLTAFRILFVSLVVPPFLYLFVLSFIVPWDGGDESWVPWLVVGLGALAISLVPWARQRPIDATSPERLGASYRSNICSRIGLAEFPVLAGIVGAFIGGSLWIYLIGLALGLLGLSFAAPSARDIRRRQEDIAARGSPLSLLEALTAPRPGKGGEVKWRPIS